MPSTRIIHACLFFVELIVSIFLSLTSYWVLKSILPVSDASVAAAISTLSALWFIHVTLRAIISLQTGVRGSDLREEMSPKFNPLIIDFESKMNNTQPCNCRACVVDETNHNEDKGSPFAIPKPSDIIAKSKNLIRQSAVECRGQTANISISILAIGVTVFLQCAVRLFALLHSINRTLVKKRQTSKRNGSVTSFFDIPFTVGENMSLGGRSFFVFYFLDGWLDRNGVDLQTDEINMLEAVSFEQIAINSSHIIVEKLEGQDEASASPHSLRLGLALGDILCRLTVHLKRNTRSGQTTTNQDSTSNSSVRSITITLRVQSVEFALLPSIDRIKASGIQINAKVAFNSDTSFVPRPESIGMTLECNQLSEQGYCTSGDKFANGSLLKSKEQIKVISWDTLQSSFYLREMADLSSQCDDSLPTTKVVSLISFPSGSIIVSAPTHQARNESFSQREASIILGNTLNIPGGTQQFCRNRLAVGFNLEVVPTFFFATNCFLRAICCILCINSASQTKENHHRDMKKSVKRSGIDVVELDALLCTCFYIPCIVDAEALYLSSSSSSFYWRKTIKTSSDCSVRSDSPILTDQKQDHGVCPLYMMFKDLHLQYYDGSFVDIFLLDGMKSKLINAPANKGPSSYDQVEGDPDHVMKYALTDIGRIVVRISDKVVKRIAQITTTMKKAARSANDMKFSANQLKRLLSNEGESILLSTSVQTKKSQHAFDVMKLCLTYVDIVVELQPPCHNDNEESVSDDWCIRIAILQRRTVAHLRYTDSKIVAQLNCETEIDLPLPDELFDSELLDSDRTCVTEADVSRLEVSVTFYPHKALPVAKEKATEKICNTFYGQFNGLLCKIASPSQSQMVNATVRELRAYELIGNPTGTSFLSIPVHEFSICGKGYPGQISHWPMLQAYKLDYDICDPVEILVGTGKFCRVEKKDATPGQKVELISIQLSKGTSDPQLYWSSVLQWLQASCNDRIQRGIDYIKSSLSNNSRPQRQYPSRKTRIRILVNSNTTATVHTSLGVKTVMHTILENGVDINISITKHQTSNASAGKKGTKPNILCEAGRILVMLNNIKSPTFVFSGLVLKNITRRSSYEEISEYVKMKGKVFEDFDRELVTDHDGHPVTEIFDMKLASCTAKFHPNLLFGEVIDDFLLTPRSLDIGLDSLKSNPVKKEKRYQLMSIRVTFSFVDVSLMDYTSCADKKSPSIRDELLLQDVARAYFESIDVTIERKSPPEVIQSQISSLDEDKTSVYTYGPTIQGGELRVDINHLVVTLIPLNLSSPSVCINGFYMVGSLFLSGLSPDTPGIVEGRKTDALILCHHVFMTSERFGKSNCGCCYSISCHSNGIPVKLYADCKVHCTELDASYGQVMNSSIPQLMECIQRLLPPPQNFGNQNAKCNPLTWWDNVRFFVHGKTFISADSLTARWLLDTQYVLDQSILLTCRTLTINHFQGYFGIDAKELNISTPGASYDMSVHPSRKRVPKVYDLPREVEFTVGEERHPLIYVPSIAVEISFSWKTFHDTSLISNDHYSNGHHFSYVEIQSLGGPNKSQDKFNFFRSDGVSVTFELNMPGTELIGNWIVLRIDILPWFTHINSIATSSHTNHEQRSESFPRFRTVAIKACVNDLEVATWFTGEKDIVDWDVEDVGGVCLTIKSVSYTALGNDQDLIIKGPVKAALLDVSDFIDSLECHEEEDKEMKEIERMGRHFGGNDEDDSSSSVEVSASDSSTTATPFFRLQELTSNIDELDYVVNAGQIDIHNKSLQSILAGTRAPEGGEEHFEGVDKTTWSILVSQLKILWTLDIRDNLMALTQDLLFTIGFMKSQLRQSQLLAEQAASASLDDNHRSVSFSNTADDGVEMTLTLPTPKKDHVENESRLEYLLQREVSFDLEIDGNGAYDYGSTTHSSHSEERESVFENPTIPTIDIHFSNPQIQLHNKRTSGSIILAMEGAHVEGRKFLRFLVESHTVSRKISPSDLTRRTEHLYTLTNMQAYSLNTRVDITSGLPWLEVCVPDGHYSCASVDNLEERFGIAGNGVFQSDESAHMHGDCKIPFKEEPHHTYPPHLRHHEPLAFLKTGLLCQILDQFTFKSRQLFHRPPIHYSTDELIGFIEQGLVSKQHDAIVDEVDLKIDLLHFKLDSYQFKTTIDIIRNVLLEPPKPRRHRKFDGEECDPQTPSNRVSSVAAIEMEDILASDLKHRGKQGREKLRSAAMNLLRDLEDRHALSGASITRRISYRLKKLKWCIQSPDSVDNIEIAFTGFFGLHDYSSDGCVSSQFELEDVRVMSSKPGPDSICFADPTSVVKPVLDERSPCQRCGKRFDHSQNDLHSCSFHTGKFRSSIWSCCESTNENTPGCKNGPHTGKERAATARVETLPRIIDGITLYSHFEVNIFPEIPHALIVQISKSLSKLFMTYFFIGDEDTVDADAVSIITDATGSTEAFSTSTDHTPRQKTVLFGGRGSSRESVQVVDDASELETEVDSQAEIVFIKVWRVGHLNIEVSFGGFRRLPQRTIDICVPAYSRAYKIGSWAYLGQKYLTYLIHEVLKSGASSAIFRRKLTGGTSDFQHIPSETLLPKPAASSDSKDLPTHDTFIGRHLRRPMGAEAILGTPSRQLTKPKMKVSFVKK